MNKNDIVLGREYLLKHSSGLIRVRVLGVQTYRDRGPRSITRYTCINLKTGREITVKSAVRFKYLSEVGQ